MRHLTTLPALLATLLLALTLTACGDSERAQSIEGLTGDATAGKTLWDANCARCHGADAKGTAAGDNLTTSGVKGHSDASYADTIIDGDGAMPAFGDSMSDQDIADTIAYLRQLQG